LINFDQLDLPS